MTAPVVGLLMTAGALPATAGSPTCSDLEFLGIEVHGHHVVRDYVTDGVADWPPKGGSVGQAVAGSGAAMAGGPAAGGHFDAGIAPGASFCNWQSNSPGFHVPE